MGGRWFWVLLVLLGGVYAALAAWTPIHDDELYYWCWSKELQLSYFDHPPLTALMIRASTELLGDSVFAIRLPAVVATLVVLGVVGWLTRPRGILLATVLTPMFTFGGVMITPDTPLLLFWSLYLAWLVGVHQRLTPEDGSEGNVAWWWWGVGGVILGIGILGKYTTGLAVPAGLLSFALTGQSTLRRWAWRYAAHLGVAFLVGSPILIYNFQHGFEPLLFQWKHANQTKSGGLQPFGEFVGVQVLLTGALPLLLWPWLLWRFRTLVADPRLRVCACLYGLPTAFFTAKSITGPLEANWAMASYLAFWPIAARWFTAVDALPWLWRMVGKWGGRLTFLAPAVSVGFLGAHMVHPLPVVPANNDRISRMPERQRMAAELHAFLKAQGQPIPLFTPEYQTVALLRFNGVLAEQEPDLTLRPSHFTQAGRRMTDHDAVYYFSNYPPPPEHIEGFAPPKRLNDNLVKEFPLVVRGEVYDTYKLWLYRKPSPTPPDSRVSAVGPRP
ncbi:MAG: glycosyltransferase family 39 protein [Fimbriiglobus sp.]|nr:glycosyltransferase family 39 protein [Fimbriiglobus sp.]